MNRSASTAPPSTVLSITTVALLLWQRRSASVLLFLLWLGGVTMTGNGEPPRRNEIMSMSLRLPTFSHSPFPKFGEFQRSIGETEKRAATLERIDHRSLLLFISNALFCVGC